MHPPPGHPVETPQERFDRQYMTVSEMADRLGISSQLLSKYRSKGDLPEWIQVGSKTIIWERNQAMSHIHTLSEKLAILQGQGLAGITRRVQMKLDRLKQQEKGKNQCPP